MFGSVGSKAKAVARTLARNPLGGLPAAVASRQQLRSIRPIAGMSVLLLESGREGWFVFTLGDYSSFVALDTRQGVYVASYSVASSFGVWARKITGTTVKPEWFYETADLTDMAAAIQAAVSFLEGTTADVGGTVLLGRGAYYLDSTITLTKPETWIEGQGSGNNANLSPADVAPTIVYVRQNSSEGFRLKGQGCQLRDFRLTSDTTRAAASFSITKPGVRIEPADSSASDRADRCSVLRMRIDSQPGDGVLLNGSAVGSEVLNTDIYSCKGMGIRASDGGYTGITRTNKLRPGYHRYINNRIAFCGGNAIAVADPAVTSQAAMGYRIHIDQLDCFGNADDAAVRYSDHAVYLFTENTTVERSGIGGSNASLTAEQHGGIYVAGRDIELNNNRYVDTAQPVTVGEIASQPTAGVWIRGFRTTQTSLTIAEAVVITAGATGVHMEFEYWTGFTLPMTAGVEASSFVYRGYSHSPAVARTISSGSLTIYENGAIVRGEGGLLDDLDSILFGPTAAIPKLGTIVTLYNDQAYTITVRNNGGGTGNIRTRAAASVVMKTNQAIAFMSDGTRMIEVGGGLHSPLDDVLLLFDNASSTVPTLSVAGDTGTGIGHPGAGILTMITSGAERLRADGTNISTPSRMWSANGSATPSGGNAAVGVRVGTAGVGFYIGSGVPTLSASKGSIYVNTTATTTTTRIYVNTDGGTTWTNLTTAA